ncbi:MAG: nucleotidyltransferase family protein [Spirochaetaceae bacterium]|jgi:molybdenum cofactor cytidylyltransferase|nr:nucleotidyltransferase family protein [Spirochaetaceae bacterium]
MNDTIDAILMASGYGRRFGANKLLAPYAGKPMARHTIDLILDIRLQAACIVNVFFVAADPAVHSLASGLPDITLIENKHPELGQRESIRLGAERSTSDYMIFFPCDQPMLDAETVLNLIEARVHGAICRPEFRGVPGSPVLFSSEYRAELCSLGEGEHGRDIIKRHPQALVRVKASSSEALIDFDKPV